MARKKDTKNVNSEKNAEAEVTTATAAAEEEAKVEVITEEATQAEAPKKGGARKPKTLKEKKPVVAKKPRKSAKNAETDEAAAVEAEKADAPETLPAEKKRGGRKPMSEREKGEAAKKRAEEKAKAEKMTPVVILQYMDAEVDTAALIEAAKADFKATHKRTLITDIRLYLKPTDRAAYYVINDTFRGEVRF